MALACDKEDDSNCILDPSKPATYPGNYIDCSTDIYIMEGESTCCEVSGVKVCCKMEEKWSRVRYIAIGIGCTTVFLGTLLFTVLWCNVESEPCAEPRWILSHSCCCNRHGRRPTPRDEKDYGQEGDDDNDGQLEGTQDHKMSEMRVPIIQVDATTVLYDKG
ncbi:uncharacterized protein LOC125374822 [Haliotis rufescens]|uniref:uncharacterized protein LOC125374822 n=1 Tax=Haliotis rufescens TaxID=6454 RepID=UPI00201F90A7|nr:uncharacterized protein LOC125374822 [Haliotis rufescens]